MPTQRPLRRLLAGLTSCIGLVALMSGTPALAEMTIEGRINGLRCAEGGHVCPLENLDAHLSFELELVLQLSDGSYYFLSNVPRDTKVRHVRKQVRVIGRVVEPYRSISVESLQVEDGDGYREVWNPQAQQQAFEDIYHSGWDATSTVSEQR